MNTIDMDMNYSHYYLFYNNFNKMLAIIMKWIPWSGKSTYVRDSLQWYTVISKDIIRASWLFKKEDLVRDEEARQIKKSASELSDIVIDNTHMNINTLNSTIKLCQWLWYDVEVKDMCDSWWDCYICYLNESLRRNKNRDACVPSSVIHEMYLSYRQTILYIWYWLNYSRDERR